MLETLEPTKQENTR